MKEVKKISTEQEKEIKKEAPKKEEYIMNRNVLCDKKEYLKDSVFEGDEKTLNNFIEKGFLTKK